MNINEFTRYLYARPVDGQEWYFRDEHEDPEIQKGELVRLASMAFMGVAAAASQYGEKQVCMGLRYLINPSCGPVSYLYMDASIDFEIRSKAISSMRYVFLDLFARVIKEGRLYRDSGDVSLSYRETCYMWWDMFPRHGVPRQVDMEKIDIVICQTIGSILRINNLACQESALHGLGHWASSRPDEVANEIRFYLPHAPIELKGYAVDAMQGRIQ